LEVKSKGKPFFNRFATANSFKVSNAAFKSLFSGIVLPPFLPFEATF
jgi:hypothetical protein